MHFYDGSSRTLYKANGEKIAVSAIPNILASNVYTIADQDNDLVYEFNGVGNHIRTKSLVLGSVLYHFTYDQFGKLLKMTGRNGRETIFERDSNGKFVSILSASGKRTYVSLNSDGYIESVTDPRNKSYNMTYSGTEGLLATFQKPTGEISTFTYDNLGNLIKDEHSSGVWTTLQTIPNDANGILRRTTTAMGAQNDYFNNPGNNSGAGSSTGSIVQGPTSIPEYYKSSYVKNQNYSTSIRSGVSRTQQFMDDARFPGQLKFITYDQSFETGMSVDRSNNQSIQLASPGNPWNISSWAETSSIWDGNGSRTTTKEFDPITKTWLTTSHMGRTSTVVLDSSERPISLTQGNLNPVTYTYEMDQIKTVSQTTSRVTTYNYDSVTRLLTSIVNPLNQTTSYGYDNNERVISQTLPDSSVIGFSYDDSNRLVGITRPGRPLHSFTINSMEELGAYLSPTQLTPTNIYYDLDRKPTQILKPSGAYVNYGYDTTLQDLLTVTIPTGAITYNRDPFYRRINSIENSNSKIVYMYSGNWINYEALESPIGNQIGRIEKTSGPIAQPTQQRVYVGVSQSTIDYTYNGDELPETVGSMGLFYSPMPNGLMNKTTIELLTENITHNNFSEITNRNVTDGTTNLFSEDLTRDNLGRITQRILSISGWPTKTHNYVYDNRGRIKEVQDANLNWIRKYNYDVNGNRTSVEIGSPANTIIYASNDQDQITSEGSNTYAYNSDGVLQSKTNTVLNQTTTYTYDALGNLTQVILGNGDVITYEIDGNNRRIGKFKNTVLQIRYLWDQDQLVAEINPDGTLKRSYVYVTQSHVPDYYVESGLNYKIVTDSIGSPVLILRASDGSVIQKLEYDEFGRVLQDTRSGELAIGFAGGLSDWDTKLVRFGARDYDPVTGRWTSKDPILFQGGDTNLYGYVMNDPVNFVDSNGLWAVQVGVGVSGFWGTFGGAAEAGVGVSYSDQCGLQVGGYASAQGRAGMGIQVGGGPQVTITPSATSIPSLRGPSVGVGFEGPVGASVSTGTQGRPSPSWSFGGSSYGGAAYGSGGYTWTTPPAGGNSAGACGCR